MSEQYDDISDEVLMAYADGALDALERQKIDAALARHDELRVRLAQFERSRDVLAKAFSQPMREPVPREILQTVRAAAERSNLYNAPAVHDQKKRDLMGRSRDETAAAATIRNVRGYLAPRHWMPVAGAAAAAALIVFAFDFRMNDPDNSAGPEVSVIKDLQNAPDLSFYAVLEKAPRLSPLSWPDGHGRLQTGRIVTSFADADGRYCRAYERQVNDGSGVGGIACRINNRWEIVREVEMDFKVDDRAAAEDGTASSSSGARELAILKLAREYSGGAFFSAQEELILLGKNWRDGK